MDAFSFNLSFRRMKILFYMGHPAHFHLLKNSILSLKRNGHDIAILTKKKDILDNLLEQSGFEFTNILPEGRSNSKFGLFIGMLKRDIRLFKFARKFKPDLMAGTSVEISHIGKLLNIPSINLNEDDSHIVPFYSRFAYPFADVILSPESCKNGKWEDKSIKYPSFHELAYLHPENFIPDISVVKKYQNQDSPYFIIRFAKLEAHHDKGIGGISTNNAKQLIEILKPHGNIIITSERDLQGEFEEYRMSINILDMHHVMAYASLYIGDSQTMAAEAAVLGVPFIRINDFVGRISYLNELENSYSLGYGYKPSEIDKAFLKASELLEMKNLNDVFQKRREKMLSEKINLADYLTRFLENYQ